MPFFLQALKLFVDELGPAEPLAPSPLPYSTVAVMFSSTQPPPPTYTEQILEFIGYCVTSASVPATLAMTGLLLMILPLCETILIHEEDGEVHLRKLPLHNHGVGAKAAKSARVHKLSQSERKIDIEAQLEKISEESATAADTLEKESRELSLHDYSVEAIVAEPTRVHKLTQPERILEIEAQLEEISEENTTADETLENEDHEEWCSQTCVSLLQTMKARIEKDVLKEWKIRRID